MAGGEGRMSAGFRPGDPVTVRRAYPPGHVRTPYYLRGCSGIIASIAGEFPDPEELAYGRDGLPKKTLYRVRFRQIDLWPQYQGAADDSLVVDIYEHWLDRDRENEP
ncbi:MAG: SH3-like domain-containing protein [Pseudomonadota bacterium]